MNRIFKKILLTNGLDQEVFDDIRPRIHDENLFNQGTFVPVITMFIMVVLGIYIKTATRPEIIGAYEVIGFALLCFQQIAFRKKLRSNVATMLLSYGSMLHVLLGTLLLYLLVPNFDDIPSMVFMCAILAMPLSVVDRIWRMASFIIFNEVLFLYISYCWQEPALFAINRNHSYLFVIVSLFLYANIVMRTVQHMANKMFIEMERDIDELTRVLNRKAASTLIKRHLESRETGVFILVDVDYFKHFNDTYGHLYGDLVLQRVSTELCATFRKMDVVGRYGGDEFIVYVPGGTVELAAQRAQEIKERLLRVSDPGRTITLSIGITETLASDAGLQTIITRADEALYKAKEAGRDRYVVYNSKE